MTNLFMRFMKDEDGATAIEYGLIAALIAIAVIGTAGALGTEISTTFKNIKEALAKVNKPSS